MANMGKIVIVAALDGTYQRKPFKHVLELVPLAEKVTKLSSICMYCKRNAAFSHRISSEKDVEIIGGAEKYVALCRSCHLKHMFVHFIHPRFYISNSSHFSFFSLSFLSTDKEQASQSSSLQSKKKQRNQHQKMPANNELNKLVLAISFFPSFSFCVFSLFFQTMKSSSFLLFLFLVLLCFSFRLFDTFLFVVVLFHFFEMRADIGIVTIVCLFVYLFVFHLSHFLFCLTDYLFCTLSSGL